MLKMYGSEKVDEILDETLSLLKRVGLDTIDFFRALGVFVFGWIGIVSRWMLIVFGLILPPILIFISIIISMLTGGGLLIGAAILLVSIVIYFTVKNFGRSRSFEKPVTFKKPDSFGRRRPSTKDNEIWNIISITIEFVFPEKFKKWSQTSRSILSASILVSYTLVVISYFSKNETGFYSSAGFRFVSFIYHYFIDVLVFGGMWLIFRFWHFFAESFDSWGASLVNLGTSADYVHEPVIATTAEEAYQLIVRNGIEVYSENSPAIISLILTILVVFSAVIILSIMLIRRVKSQKNTESNITDLSLRELNDHLVMTARGINSGYVSLQGIFQSGHGTFSSEGVSFLKIRKFVEFNEAYSTRTDKHGTTWVRRERND